MIPLTGKQKQALRALAHALSPVVQIGHAGLSEAVTAQIDEALTAHELIKIKLGKECPIPIEVAGPEIERLTRSVLVQRLGRVITAFRRNQQKPKVLVAAKATRASADATARSKRSGRQLRRKTEHKHPRARAGSARSERGKRAKAPEASARGAASTRSRRPSKKRGRPR